VTTNASRLVPKPDEQTESLFSTSSRASRSEAYSTFPALWYDALSFVVTVHRWSPGTWLQSSPTYYQDLIPHGSSTTIVYQRPEEPELDASEDLSEESLPLIAHRRYQISATFSFKGPAPVSLLGGGEILEE